MDITNTSNEYVMLAEAQCRAGADMEDIAHKLAIAFQAVVCEGLVGDDAAASVAEYDRLRKSPYEPLPVDYYPPKLNGVKAILPPR